MHSSSLTPLAILALVSLVSIAVSCAPDTAPSARPEAVQPVASPEPVLAHKVAPVAQVEPTQPVTPVHFEKQILPLLRERCFECHSAQAKKIKSGLRLDGKNWILTGGKHEGPAVLAGRPTRSPLIDRAGMYYEDEGVMPPNGSVYPNQELSLIRRWIAEGASFGTWTGAGGIEAPKIERNLLIPEPPNPIAAYDRIAAKLSKAPREDIQAVRAQRVLISNVSPGSALLRVELVQTQRHVDDASLAVLAKLRDHVAILRLRHSKISDAAMEAIGKLPNLTELSIRHTAITDEGLRILAQTKLPELMKLDLEGTAITDEGLAHLVGYPNLHTLTIRGTQVTAAGAEKLGKLLPRCRIYLKPERSRAVRQPAAGAEAADK